MNHSKRFFLPLMAALASTAAHAHSGEHTQQTLQWLAHLCSSSHHLIALLVVAALVGVVACTHRWLKSCSTPSTAVTSKATAPAIPFSKR